MKNFRDLGGFITEDGREVKGGLLYRASALCVKSAEDKEILESLNVDSIIDFRCAEEVRGKKDYIPAGCAYVFAPVFAERNNPYIAVTLSAKLRTILLCGKKIQKMYDDKLNSYKNFPFATAYNKLFEKMDCGDKIIFHCTAGKDRTGFAAALVLTALGVSREAVFNDYILSNMVSPGVDRSVLRYIGLSKAHIAAIEYCESVHPELLQVSFTEIEKRYDTFADYLLSEFDVSPERIAKWKKYYLK